MLARKRWLTSGQPWRFMKADEPADCTKGGNKWEAQFNAIEIKYCISVELIITAVHEVLNLYLSCVEI